MKGIDKIDVSESERLPLDTRMSELLKVPSEGIPFPSTITFVNNNVPPLTKKRGLFSYELDSFITNVNYFTVN